MISERAENLLAAALGAGAVWLVFRTVAKTAVTRQIMAGISQLDTRFDRDRADALASMPIEAQVQIHLAINRALIDHLGITEAQLQSLIRDIRKVRALP